MARIWALIATFVLINALDYATTLYALSTGRYVELNSLVAGLLARPLGPLIWLALKYIPLLPLAYMASWRSSRYELAARVARLNALCVLIALNLVGFYVVFINNIPQLLGIRLPSFLRDPSGRIL
jgi:hypothetical protein